MSGRIRLREIFSFWSPLAGTWIMMGLEAPFLAAVIARLAEPKHNLAAFGVAYAVAILIESPVIMILSASTALVEGPRSFRKLRNFTYGLNVGMTAVMLGLLLTPAWISVARNVIGLPSEIARLSQTALLLMVAWPAAIGYRRFYQGLLIRHGRTRQVAYGTVVRLVFVSAAGLLLYLHSTLPGAWIGGAAITVGVCAEAVASRLMVQPVVRRVLRSAEDNADADAALTYRRIVGFYYPLALTSVISLSVHPVVSLFMGFARFPLESLAVLPVVNSLAFIFRSAGLSYQEVAIAMLARSQAHFRQVARFALLLALASSAGLAIIGFTPLVQVWFERISGLSPELAGFAVTPTRILCVLPALSVLLSLQRAVLVHVRVTAPVGWGTLLEVAGICTTLFVAVKMLGMVGVTAAAVAFCVGRLLGNSFLMPAFIKRGCGMLIAQRR